VNSKLKTQGLLASLLLCVPPWRDCVKSLRFFGLGSLPVKIALFILLSSTFLTPTLSAAVPVWWSERDVLEANKPADDYAVLNQGQLKHIATRAAAELNTRLPGDLGGAGLAINDLIISWQTAPGSGVTRDDYAAVNHGQLKAVADLFYLRLIAVGYTTERPWTNSPFAPDHYATANLGQVKYLFSFDLSAPAGQLPTWWQNHYFPGQTGIDPQADADGDGLTNLEEYQATSDPNDYFSQGNATITPQITIISGNNQTGQVGVYSPDPLVIKVIRADSPSTVLSNAPVTFTVSAGSGQLDADTAPPTTGTSFSTTTDANGLATANYLFAPEIAEDVQVTAQSGAPSVVFHLNSQSLPSAPGNLLSTATSSYQANLSWIDSAANETGYKVERSLDGISFTEIAFDLPANSTSFQDSGLDGLTEYHYRIRAFNANGNSAYSNTTTVTTSVMVDGDGDGMPDGWEIANGLNPLVEDSLEDKDGDRVPNIFEFKRGTFANSATSKPPSTLVVDPVTGGTSTEDNMFATLQEAVNAAEGGYNYEIWEYSDPNPYAVIEVKAGVYEESVNIGSVPLVILGELGSIKGPVEIRANSPSEDYALKIYGASVVDGLVITHKAGSKGAGVYVAGYSYAGESTKRRLVNCLIRNNATSNSGGGVYNQSANLTLDHCTIFANTASWNGNGIYNSSGRVTLRNSIVWNPVVVSDPNLANQEISTDGTVNPFTVSNTIVGGGEQTGINIDPQLTPAGWLKSPSPAINRVGVPLIALDDIHGERRDQDGTPDLGADEYRDDNGTADGDGLPDWAEGLDDNDGLSALDEYRIYGTNPRVPDTDGDGLNDGAEIQAGTNPLNADTDRDGMPDGWEIANGLNPLVEDAAADFDGDGLSNLWEFTYGFDPSDPADAARDTSANGIPDWWEITHFGAFGNVDASADADGDGLSNLQEYQNGTNPKNWDTDGDLLPDGWEVQYGLDPLDATGDNGADGDPDGDGLSNFQEWTHGASPFLADTDGDGANDGVEVGQGSLPNDLSDGGQPPPEDQILEMKIIIGDPSGSHSERWRVEVRDLANGKTVVNHASREFGELSPDAESIFKQFRKGKAYELKLVWVATDPAKLEEDPTFFPDYDWALEVSYKNDEGAWVDVKNDSSKRFVVLDPWNPATNQIAESNVQLLVSRNELQYPWEGQPDRTEQYQQQVAAKRAILIPVEIIPNFNRDEAIDLTGSKDRGKVTEQKPLRWWINDDSDNGDIASGDSDVPGALAGWSEFDHRDPNHDDTKVNGRCDLPDFFPLFFDLKQMIEVLPPSGSIQYKLKHEESALGFVYTDLMPDQADDFCVENATTGYGPNFTQPAKDATVTKITSAGVVISATFLNKIKNDGKGVVLFEASKATDKPLVLEVIKDGQKLTEIKFFLKADSVEKMYRWVNLRGVEGVGGSVKTETSLAQPENYPDDLTNGKNFIFVHGYSVREKQAEGWNSETFKRLHQLGSKAKYVAVIWRGDEGKLVDSIAGIGIPYAGGATLDYGENVINAFLTSPHLASVVNSLSGEKYIAGHSLGNMVATSAIKDFSMSVNKYFMVNAAVAMEAYDASLESNQTMRGRMRNPDWQNYHTRLWSTEWYKKFAPGDGRRDKLTWRGRFGNIGNAINFYSSTEDVLQNNPNGQVPPINSKQGILMWSKGEMEKGSALTALVTWDSHGGWGFNAEWNNTIGYEPHTGTAITVPRTPTEANTLTDPELQTNSFFKRFDDNRLYNASQGSAAANEYNTHSKMLAEALPALSFATGANSLDPFQNRNVNMMSLKTGTWPRVNPEWRHSDFREVAFYFTQRLYKRFIDEGELKQ